MISEIEDTKDAMKTMETKILTLLICGLAAMGAITRRIGDSHLVLGFVLPMAIVSRRRLGLGQGDESEDNFVYGAFGEGNSSGKKEPFKYTGRTRGYSDERTNDVLNWNRRFSQHTGRWNSRDSFGIQGGLNLYSYVENDPITHWDESGKAAPAIIAIGGIVGVMIIMEFARQAILDKTKTKSTTCRASNICTENEQKQIRDAKDHECKNGGCNLWDSRQTTFLKLQSAAKCVGARLYEQKNCFDVPDLTHLVELGASIIKLNNCIAVAAAQGLLQ